MTVHYCYHGVSPFSDNAMIRAFSRRCSYMNWILPSLLLCYTYNVLLVYQCETYQSCKDKCLDVITLDIKIRNAKSVSHKRFSLGLMVQNALYMQLIMPFRLQKKWCSISSAVRFVLWARSRILTSRIGIFNLNYREGHNRRNKGGSQSMVRNYKR